MYEKFTDRARKAMRFANDFAQIHGRPTVVLQDVFWGILKEGGGVACNAVRRLGFDTDEIKTSIEANSVSCRTGTKDVSTERLPLANSVTEVFLVAEQASQDWGNSHIGTEHLMYAMLGMSVFSNSPFIAPALNKESFRQAVLDILLPKAEENKTGDWTFFEKVLNKSPDGKTINKAEMDAKSDEVLLRSYHIKKNLYDPRKADLAVWIMEHLAHHAQYKELVEHASRYLLNCFKEE